MSTTKRMTKTEGKRLVAELRREAAKITDALTPTPQWVLDQIGAEPPSQTEIDARIAQALLNIDHLSASLRGLIIRER